MSVVTLTGSVLPNFEPASNIDIKGTGSLDAVLALMADDVIVWICSWLDFLPLMVMVTSAGRRVPGVIAAAPDSERQPAP